MPTIIGQKRIGAVTPLPVPKLIHHGQDVTSASYINANAAALDALPFDGLTFQMGSSLSTNTQKQVAVTNAQYDTALAPIVSALATMTNVTEMWVMVYSTPAGDLFDDWSTCIQNFANLAEACADAGVAGIFYDIEEYFGASLSYPTNAAGKTVAQAQAQAQLRGKQIMDAMRAVWPEVKILSTYGAWLSETKTAAAMSAAGIAYNDVAFANQLRGPFVVGMVESAAGTSATVVDGGEIYTPRTAAQFQAMKAWQKSGMASESSLIPVALAPSWASSLSAGFGIYDKAWQGASMDVTIWQSTLANALNTADEYVWTYIESYDWLGGGWPTTDVPQSWIDATWAARTAAGI